MDKISLIIGYKEIFEDTPQSVEAYLRGVNKKILLDYAIFYCHCDKSKDIYYGFINKDDKGTAFYYQVSSKINHIHMLGENPIILNARTSLRLLEIILDIDVQEECYFQDIEVRKKLLKAYLLLNDEEKSVASTNPNEPLENLILHMSLKFELYKENNYLHHWLSQIIKAILFFNYAETRLPTHYKIFTQEYKISSWKEYITNLHQLIKLTSEYEIDGKSDDLSSIMLDQADSKYHKKKHFLDRFCIPVHYSVDFDFTSIKSTPVIFRPEDNKYSILYRPFFIDKIYNSLYFSFKEINNSLKETDDYIDEDDFRRDYGNDFSEKRLLNKIMKDAFKNKYKHLGYEDLKDKGLPDYYIRNGNKVVLFENKDNLINKNILDRYNVNEFIQILKDRLFESVKNNGKCRPKGCKQLINSIESIINGKWNYDTELKHKKCIFYPIIIVNHKEFSLSGVNQLVNEWFNEEIEKRVLNKGRIKNITIIHIDTLIIYQGLLAEKQFNLFDLIDEYWSQYRRLSLKKYPNKSEVVNSLPDRYKSFDVFLSIKFTKKDIFQWQITQYCKVF